MAVSLMFLSARRALTAAPLPRPPAPIRPSLMVSLPPARTLLGNASWAAPATAPAARVDLIKSRRDVSDSVGMAETSIRERKPAGGMDLLSGKRRVAASRRQLAFARRKDVLDGGRSHVRPHSESCPNRFQPLFAVCWKCEPALKCIRHNPMLETFGNRTKYYRGAEHLGNLVSVRAGFAISDPDNRGRHPPWRSIPYG